MFSHRPGPRLPTPLRYAVTASAVAVVVPLGLVGCGGDDDAVPGLSPSPTSSVAADRTFQITVTGRQVDPAPSTLDLAVGEALTLVVTSDHDDELHAHGFEVEEELAAGVPTRIVLTGDVPGVYEVETHDPALRLLQVAVR